MDNEQDGPPTSMNLAIPENFSHVVFTNVQHHYPPNTDILCSFQKIKSFQSATKDWVGIFKVGWQNTKEYYTWVSASRSGEDRVLFKAYYLPKDEDFYQFCYVDHTGEVRGISNPFRFSSDITEDENEIMLVTTEGELEKINEENRMLKEELEKTNKEIKMLKEENQNQTELIQMLQAEHRNTSEKIVKSGKENQDLQLRVKHLEEENESLKNKTCEAAQEQYKIKEQELLSLWEKMKAETKQLQSESTAKQQALENTICLMEKCKEEIAGLKEELEAQKGTLETEKKLKEELQQFLDEKNKKLLDAQNNIKELQIQLGSNRQDTTTLEQKLASLESENVTKGEEEKKLRAAIAHLEFKVTTLQDSCKEHLRNIEKEKEENGRLEGSLDIQNKKLLDAENNIRALQTQLKSSRQEMTTLEQRLASLEDENQKKTRKRQKKSEEIREVKLALELRTEEVNDLNIRHIRVLAEIKDLRQAQLAAALDPRNPFSFQDTSLYYRNPYEGPSSSMVSENEPQRSFETTLVDEIRPPPEILTCPICGEEFTGDAKQVYEDHVMCHSAEMSLPPQREIICEVCSQVILGDKQMFDDHMMCHSLELEI